jgi:hypothetical protein
MANEVLVAEAQGLSQIERVVDTFVAPTKTFSDILRSTSCWLPLVIMFLMTLFFAYSIDKTIGYEAASETQISKSSAQAEALQQLSEADRASRMALTAKITRISSYASVIFVLIFMAIEAAVLLALFNFVLGASTKFGQVFAVVAFAGLPRALMWVISGILLFAGVGTDNFDLRNPVGTNLGYYLQDSPKWISTPATFLDVLGLWSLALLIVGMAIISRKKISQSATVIGVLWLVILVISTGLAAAFS